MKYLIPVLLFCGVAMADPNIKPDITVATDGSGQFKTVHEAVQSIPKDNTERKIVLVKNGTYKEKVRIDASFITLRGESRDKTRIEFSQLNEEYDKNKDDLGRAVVNINSDDVIIQNITIENTAGVVGPHAFTVFGRGDRTVITDSDIFSHGADTLSLWKGDTGRYYHARCNFRGSVDFVCPRGWCFIRDCTFYEMKATAAIWHDGKKNKDQKFVLRNCKFDGVEGFVLGRHHVDAQFYLLDCTFSKTMADRVPQRVIYPLSTSQPTEADIKKNAELDKENLHGERVYFHNCKRDGGDFPWHANNLEKAEGAPTPEQITPAWTFAGTWDPESTQGPKIKSVTVNANTRAVELVFSEPVTVKGSPKLTFKDGQTAPLRAGSGTDTLKFVVNGPTEFEPKLLEIPDGAIIASQASATIRVADLALP